MGFAVLLYQSIFIITGAYTGGDQLLPGKPCGRAKCDSSTSTFSWNLWLTKRQLGLPKFSGLS
jgi:hypothetical protein